LQLYPSSLPDATAAAQRLINRGLSIDLGLGQINSRNLSALGLSVSQAFDPCRNLAASAQVVAAGYQRAAPVPGLEQAALQTSLSFYNTGDPRRGFRNGYVAKVLAAAHELAPPIAPNATPSADPGPPTPPAWDVFGEISATKAAFVFSPNDAGATQ
jgi:type IV secretion system protein VirB1